MKFRTCIAMILSAAAVGVCLLPGCSPASRMGNPGGDPGKTEAPSTEIAEPSLPPLTTSPIPAEALPTEPVTPPPTEKPTRAPEDQDYSGGIKKDSPRTVSFYKGSGTRSAFCGTGHTLALQFYATAPFTAVGFECPTWQSTQNYGVEYRLFRWQGDYIDTTMGPPAAEETFDDFQDGVWVSLSFDPLPPGEYLLTAGFYSEAAMDNSGVWLMESEFADARSYLDDEVWYDKSICAKIRYTVTPNNLFGPLSDSGLD